MELTWMKCKGGIWCEVFKVDTSHKLIRNTDGVYIVWTVVKGAINVVKVGCGNIAEEIDDMKRDLAMMAFAAHGAFISWSDAPTAKHAGICSFLTQKVNPTMHDSFPSKGSIEVNLPWEG